MGSRLISPRMLAGLTAFFPARVVMQEALATRDEVGQPLVTWSDVADLADLRGQLAPASEEKLKRLGLTVEKTTHVLGLNGCYRGITPVMRAVVSFDSAPDGSSAQDAVVYEVTGVRHDSQGVITYLGLALTVASAGDLAP